MSEHTKEKLRLETTRSFIDEADCHLEPLGIYIPESVSDEDARRLVACWNAFDGISTEDIEAASPVKGLITRYIAALRQRDQLLAAAQSVVAHVLGGGKVKRSPDQDGYYSEPIHKDDLQALVAAIAAVKRGES